MLPRLVQCRQQTRQSAGYKACLILLLLILISDCSCVIDEPVTLLALATHSSTIVLQHTHKEAGADMTYHVQRSPSVPKGLTDSLGETLTLVATHQLLKVRMLAPAASLSFAIAQHARNLHVACGSQSAGLPLHGECTKHSTRSHQMLGLCGYAPSVELAGGTCPHQVAGRVGP